MERDIKEILFREEDLRGCVSRIAGEINRDYRGKSPIIVGILQGSFVFLADLIREITVPVTLEFMSVSSYGAGSTSSGEVNIRMDLAQDIKGKDLILVEDILDSGNTLSDLLPELKKRGPASVRLCVLLDKPDRREKEVPVDYRGFSIADEFVVGYGMDYNQQYRNLPYVGILKPSVYE